MNLQTIIVHRWTRLLDCFNRLYKILYFYEVTMSNEDEDQEDCFVDTINKSSIIYLSLSNDNRLIGTNSILTIDWNKISYLWPILFGILVMINCIRTLMPAIQCRLPTGRTINGKISFYHYYCYYYSTLMIILLSINGCLNENIVQPLMNFNDNSTMFHVQSVQFNNYQHHEQSRPFYHYHQPHRWKHHWKTNHYNFNYNNDQRSPITSQSHQSPLLEAAQHQNSITSTLNNVRTDIFVNKPSERAQTKCIARCSCKWRSGKIWIECTDANLHQVPKGLDSGTQVLYLSGNPLTRLEARAFERVELRNIQRLYLVNTGLTELNIDALQQLTNLIELDLAQNELSILPTDSLLHCPILRKLILSNNKITKIPNSAFNKLTQLQTIDFSANGIELIEPGAFYGLKNLKQLYLHDNKLR